MTDVMTTDTLLAVIGVAMLAVLASLGTGLVAMVQGGEFNRRYGNLLMRMRVLFQGVAVAALLVAMLVAA